jgi:hypothetical protein
VQAPAPHAAPSVQVAVEPAHGAGGFADAGIVGSVLIVVRHPPGFHERLEGVLHGQELQHEPLPGLVLGERERELRIAADLEGL